MGVHGLWKLLEAAGKPVPLETLENKVLAVDVSIWLHQMMKGYQDSRGAPVPNAHLLGLFHRVCKLLFYRIKPVFVFDGGVPLLKKQTIAARKKQKKQASQNAAEAKERLLKNLVKSKAIRHILHGPSTSNEVQDSTPSSSKDDMFNLPPIPNESMNTDSEDEPEDRLPVFMDSSVSDENSEPETKPSLQLLASKLDLHTLDVHSEEFCSLPPDVRHDILSELKETRKQNSWGRLHEMPEESGDFSSFQLKRLIKRRNVQVSLEKAEKEMGGKVMRMSELQELMTAQGVNIIEDDAMLQNASQRIASDPATRFVLCKDSVNAASSSQSSSIGSSDKIDDNLLYNEQVEFIAQMAESMLQKLSKNKGEFSIKIKEEDNSTSPQQEIKEEIMSKILSDNKPTSSGPIGTNETGHGILVDSWSSDDDDMKFETKRDEAALKAQQCKSNKKIGDCSAEIGFSNNEHVSHGTRDKFSEPSEDDFVETSSDEEQSAIVTGLLSRLNESDSSSHSEEQLKQSPVCVVKSGTERSRNLSSPQSVPTTQANSGLQSNKSLEIIICPKEKPDDDLFADIFDPGFVKEASRPDNTQSQTSIEQRKPLEILIHPQEKPNEDDIFADVFDITSAKSRVGEAKALYTDKEERLNTVLGPEINKQGQDEQNDVLSKLTVGEDDGSSSEEESTAVESNPPASSLFIKPPTSSELTAMEASLEAEQLDLLKERGRNERLAASITDQMCVEAQELLQLFGLPYVVAPMEAEAQCAFLDVISLTEGSITDDSDIWLFGGKKVYKNFFNQKKHVLQFTSSNINHYFKLSREQLVQLALLVGSDYTTGIPGIGPVTALEVVAAFQSKVESDPVKSALKGLSQFRDWWTSGRPHQSNRMRLLDKKLKNVAFSEGFPSQAVVEAYMRPSVEDSQETFSWGALDLPALREYARSKFGWTASKTDEILMPVSKRWTARTSQRSIDSYFNLQPQLVEGLSKMSKRVQKAVTMLEAEDSDNVDNPEPETSSSQKEKKPVKRRQQTSKDNGAKSKRAKGKVNQPLLDRETEKTVDVVNENVQHRTISKGSTKIKAELPVRAPIVPRERNSTGVKRVGVKSSEAIDTTKIVENFKDIGQAVSVKDDKKKQGISKICSLNPSSKTLSKSSVNEKNSTVSERKDSKAYKSNIEVLDCQPSTSGVKDHRVESSSPELLLNSSQRCDGGSLNMSADLAALSEMNWEDDPWDAEMPSEESRPKIYFGGIRPNKPRKSVVSRPLMPSQAADTRGVQPGWITREQMESRTALVDSMARRKQEQTIPQRDQDQRALEEAKMKAIELVKASGVKQAARLLGRNAKRGRNKARPKRIVLPEHNLSESSSDD